MTDVLIVDDEIGILNALQRELRGQPWRVTAINCSKEAMTLLETRPFDIVISDYRMPEVDGVQLLTQARKLQPNSVRMILSGYTDAKAMLRAVNDVELFRYLVKPWRTSDLIAALNDATKKSEQIKVGKKLMERAVRQKDRRRQQEEALKRLEQLEPGLTDVDFSPDGTIWLAATL